MTIKRIQVIIDIEEGGLVTPLVLMDKDIPCDLGVSICQTKKIQPRYNTENLVCVELEDTRTGSLKIEWERK